MRKESDFFTANQASIYQCGCAPYPRRLQRGDRAEEAAPLELRRPNKASKAAKYFESSNGLHRRRAQPQ